MLVDDGFRPLTGINFNSIMTARIAHNTGFRPLTEINFNGEKALDTVLNNLVYAPSRG